ncbi:MAG: sigma factor-like helix-turn-helix DNA-binding protein [Planctomycetota bacterium]|nr:sigma factor-like helix-turn-helix DNA-binding protein [Planctomycetota bacterium]
MAENGQINGVNPLIPGTYGPVCRSCPIRSGCHKICDLVENILPSMEKARVDAEDLSRLFMGVRTVNVMLDNIEMLTPRQREVVQLYYRESLMQQEIAEKLQVSQQAVADSLVRARRAVGRHFGAKEMSRNSQQPPPFSS